MPGTRVATGTQAGKTKKTQPGAVRTPRKKAAAKAAPPKAGRLAAVTAQIVAPRRADASALVEAGRMSAAGVKRMLQRCQVIVRDTVSELRGVVQLMQHVGARSSVAQLDKLAIALLMLSISSLRELAALASTTQRAALDILATRLQDDLMAFRAMRAKKG